MKFLRKDFLMNRFFLVTIIFIVFLGCTQNEFVEVPEFYWDGGHALDLPILGLSKDVSTVEIDRVEVIGLSELWSEKKVSVPLILGQQIVDIEVWISGPVRSLLNAETSELISVSYTADERFYSISCQTLTRDVSVLSVQPNVIEKLN